MKVLSYQSQALAGRSRLELASVTAGRKTSLAPLMTFHPDIRQLQPTTACHAFTPLLHNPWMSPRGDSQGLISLLLLHKA
jgi:hypothetical protein